MRQGRTQAVEELRGTARPSPEEVRAQLARIVGSPEFVVPERARIFLGYVVEETLAGRADRLKGYSIGLAVFEREESFDSQADPVVRIEAGRLRRALERYYLVAGQADPVQIEIPKGGYVPTFNRRAEPAPALAPPPPTPEVPLAAEESPAAAAAARPPAPAWSASWRAVLVIAAVLATLAAVSGAVYLLRSPQPAPVAEAPQPDGPTLLVAPFASLSEGEDARLYAAGLTEELLTQLSGFKELTVLGRETTRSVPASAEAWSVARELAARYVLAGSLRVSEPEVRVTSRLVDTETGVVLWARTYAENLRAKDLFAIQQDIAREVATAVAQPYGAIFRADLQKTANQPPDDLDAYACTLRFYLYRAELGPDRHALVRGCLERAVARFPGYTTAWAMLSLLELDEARFDLNPDAGKPDPVERALLAARRAVELDADNARAQQALMMALFFHGEVEEGTRVGEQALAWHPNDSELLAEFGLRVALAGEWQRGRELVEGALARNPGNSGYYHAVLALIAHMQGDGERALSEIRQASLEKFALYHAVAAIIYVERGLMAEAREEAALFAKLRPGFLEHLDAELAKRNVRPEDRTRMAEGLRKAGLTVTGAAAVPAAQPPTDGSSYGLRTDVGRVGYSMFRDRPPPER